MGNNELVGIVEKFAGSGWDLIDGPSKAWLSASESAEAREDLLKAVMRADRECGSCGCEFDPLYKRAIELLQAV